MKIKEKEALIIKALGDQKVKRKVPLAPYTTFGIGGPADLLYPATIIGDLVRAVAVSKKAGSPYLILGGGSNLLVADEGYRGLVIVNQTGLIEERKRSDGVAIKVDSGIKLSDFVEKMADKGLSGLEFCAGIPGSLGGAIWGNAGAWRQQIGDKIIRVSVLDSSGKIKWLEKNDCRFAYRQSRFKDSGEVILRGEFLLRKSCSDEIRYEIRKYLAKRQHQPKKPSAGCVFINPENKPAGLLIQELGLKGKKIGGAMVSPDHANFIVNTGWAKAKDVLRLINLIKEKIWQRYRIQLETEINLVGFGKID